MMTDSSRAREELSRIRLKRAAGYGVARLQDVSLAFDALAAEILAVDRSDLPCIAHLLFVGPASAGELAEALGVRRAAAVHSLERLQSAGYARPHPEGRGKVELTEHAKEWVERIWGPLKSDGYALLDGYRTRELEAIAEFVGRACDLQEARIGELRGWLEAPSSPARRTHLRGGLSPGALRRVQLFIESNLDKPIRLRDLAARAALSRFHFSRAFRQSVGMTPRAFVEERRIERAKRLLTESELPLAEVAGECGFSTQSRLTTAFKRSTGFTPGAYRRSRARWLAPAAHVSEIRSTRRKDDSLSDRQDALARAARRAER